MLKSNVDKRSFATWPIRLYQRWISPLKSVPSCRFYPSCSAYAIEAIETCGVWRGSGKTLWRLLRCHPFSRGGHDPVVLNLPPGDGDVTSRTP